MVLGSELMAPFVPGGRTAPVSLGQAGYFNPIALYRHQEFLVSRQSRREVVTQLAKQGILLAREVRIDQYGIRTWLGSPNTQLKFEIIREARIDLSSRRLAGIPVGCLDRPTSFAEKFLANADRGLDASTLSRDAIDLAFMMAGWSQADAVAGIRIARDAYGKDIDRKFVLVTQKLREDKRYRMKCIEGLAIADAKTLTAGLELLARDDWRGTRAK